MSGEGAEKAADPALARKSDPWTDLALTLPIFVVYHLGVIFLPFRNAADVVTSELHTLSKHSLPAYAALTLGVGVVFAGVLFTAGRRHALEPSRFARIAVEGAVYAALIRLAGSYVVGAMRLAKATPVEDGTFSNVVMAMGAGFYEEIAFRVLLFGVGAAVLRKIFASDRMGGALVTAAWGVIEACAFSYWHYTGSLGEEFDTRSFVFRAVCGLVLTAIFAFRGFAPAVWAHTLYDVWVMVFE